MTEQEKLVQDVLERLWPEFVAPLQLQVDQLAEEVAELQETVSDLSDPHRIFD